MKRVALSLLLILAAMSVAGALTHGAEPQILFDGDDVGGAAGAFIGALAAGGGIVIAGAILLLVAAVLAMLFAGLGVAVVCLLCVALAVVLLSLTPLLLPLLIPVGIIWLLARRSRRRAEQRGQHAV